MPVEIDHVEIRVYGPRNFPLGRTRIPAQQLKRFPDLLDQIQAINPAHTAGSLARWVFTMGLGLAKTQLKLRRAPRPIE